MERMKNQSPLIFIILVAFAGRLSGAAAERPNILFIMSDDHAAHAISAYGSRVNQTPNIDRLAKEGMRFDHCFAVNSICTPSRATILTGKYSHLNGVPVFNRFDGSQPTVAKYLQAAGYYTGMIGKWHLGSDPTGLRQLDILPGQGVYFDPQFLEPDGRRVIKGYVTDIITDLSIDFLKNRPKDKPFFLMCHHKAPHRPWEPDEKHRAMFAGKTYPRAGHAPRRLRHAHRRHPRMPAEGVRGPDPPRPEARAARRPQRRGAQRVAQCQADRSRDRSRRQEADAHRRGLERVEIPALHAGLPGLRAVGGRQRRPAARLARPERACARTPSSSTPATRASSSATTACTTSGSCTRSRSACRSWSAGRA